jgi:hypothetical protein
MEKDLAALIDEFDQTRKEMLEIVDITDSDLEILPGWTIREILINISSWELIIEKALKAYLTEDPPYFLQEQDFDIYNQESIDVRANSSLEDLIREWKDVRASLKKTIKKLKQSDLDIEMVLPWGSERPIYELIEIIAEHETEHMKDIQNVTS